VAEAVAVALAMTVSTSVTLMLHSWDMFWMLTLSPYWLICTLPSSNDEPCDYQPDIRGWLSPSS
jgi:hypothetical protein